LGRRHINFEKSTQKQEREWCNEYEGRGDREVRKRKAGNGRQEREGRKGKAEQGKTGQEWWDWEGRKKRPGNGGKTGNVEKGEWRRSFGNHNQ
jgi:hypothetical protein